ncbi:MAG TPA: MFS transporter [Acidimicrobiia bacterium]|nr:MFS transporter [Acidimicrobiia bacterium]
MPLGLIASLLLVNLADEWFSFLPAGAMESIRADFGLTYAQAGVLLALLPAGGLLGIFLMAAADFVSRRLLGAAGALVYALCLLTFATGRSFAVLAIASLLWGAASDAFVHATQLALAELAGDELDATLARTNVLGSVGDLLGPVTLSVASATGIGWRPVFAVGGVLMLGYAGVLAAQPLPPPQPDGSTPWSVARAVLGDTRVVRLAAIWALIALLDEPFLGFLIANLEETHGVSAAVATALVGAIVAGGIVTYTLLAAARRSFSARSRLTAASIGLLGTVVVMVATPWPAAIAFAGVGFGAAIALLWVTLQGITLRLRPRQAGTTQAAVSGLATVGVVLPPLIGMAADRLGLGPAMWLFALAPAAILLLALTVRETSRA